MILWALGGLVDDLVGIFSKAWQQDGAKWTKLGLNWQQVAPKSRQDAAKMANLVAFSLPLGGYLVNVG